MSDYTPDQIIARVSDCANNEQPLPLDIRLRLMVELSQAMRKQTHALVCSQCGKRVSLTPADAYCWRVGAEELDVVVTCRVCKTGIINLVSTENSDGREITH